MQSNKVSDHQETLRECPDIDGNDSERLKEFCRMTAVEVKAVGMISAATSLEMIGYIRELEAAVRPHPVPPADALEEARQIAKVVAEKLCDEQGDANVQSALLAADPDALPTALVNIIAPLIASALTAHSTPAIDRESVIEACAARAFESVKAILESSQYSYSPLQVAAMVAANVRALINSPAE